MKRCNRCQKLYPTKYENTKLCISCFKLRERYFQDYERIEFELEEALNELKSKTIIPKNIFTKLMHLCHPDRHGGSQNSHEVTCWLNSQRQ